MKTRITLTNEFHNTEAVVIPQAITTGRYAGYYRISRATAQRLRRELCGNVDCCCGGTFGERMHGNPIEIENEDENRAYIVRIETRTPADYII